MPTDSFGNQCSQAELDAKKKLDEERAAAKARRYGIPRHWPRSVSRAPPLFRMLRSFLPRFSEAKAAAKEACVAEVF
jgi:hypothetical protein